ncbi:MAG: winged helix-turn-helix transcriptional regulator [Clostridiales bacterium]|nr:winged helix-turn-helix transcriptional regulator [Clostridiales bacterium]
MQNKLFEIIDEAFTKGKGKEKFGVNKKERQKEAEKLKKWFEHYYQSNIEISIGEIVGNPDEFAIKIIEGIRSFPNDKYKLSLRIEQLVDYLKREFNLIIEIDEIENFKYKDRNERLMKILRYLHEGNKSRAEIAETFGISERTLSEDLKDLFNGYEFMGTTMKISEMKRGSNTYRSLIHPVFHAFHMKEIYAMTIGMKLMGKGTVFESDFNRISSQVYTQLSDVAKDMIDEAALEVDLKFYEDSMHFMNTAEIAKEMGKPYTYYLKEPIQCKVIYKVDGEVEEAVGIIKLSNNDKSLGKKIIMKTDQNTFEIDIENIIKIDRTDWDIYFSR